jgi:hypothetical protein
LGSTEVEDEAARFPTPEDDGALARPPEAPSTSSSSPSSLEEAESAAGGGATGARGPTLGEFLPASTIFPLPSTSILNAALNPPK